MTGGMYILIVAAASAALAASFVAYFFTLFPRHLAARLNGVPHSRPPPVTDTARDLHSTLFVADMHCDALMWNRDLSERGAWGHVDLPRLAEGNVSLQVFSAVTKIPLVPRHTRNSDRTDGMTPIAAAQRWPRRTWSSLVERALFQAGKLHDAAAGSNGRLSVVRTAAELERFVRIRGDRPRSVAGVLLLEGLHGLEGRVENVDRLFDAGFCIMGLVHLFDNEVGGSMHGLRRGGLTDFGRRVIERMDELGMIVDLAHASTRLIEDVLDVTTRPVVVTHTGVKGTCDTPRNLTDDEVRRVAASGGVVGIGFWKTAVCGDDPAAIVRAIRYTADLAGVDHVGLGSDFDGAVRTPFDASGLVHLTQALLDDGFDDDQIGKIMGGNTLRLLEAVLPAD
jgi:microsomal dipeptidase-like Zn-dependent dipeptidase